MLYVPTNLIQDPEMTGLDIAVWCFMRADSLGVDKTCNYVYAPNILCQMYGHVDFSPTYFTKIGKSIEKLHDAGYFNGEKVGIYRYIAENQSFDNNGEYFRQVDTSDLRKILNSNCGKHPYEVLRQYLLILTSINIKTKYSEWSLERFAAYTGRELQTISGYIRFLEELQLIYVFRHSAFSYVTNVYSRYEDRGVVDAAFSNAKKLAPTVNDKRRFSQMYNQIKAGNREYPPEIKAQILEYCIKENEKREKLYKKNPKYNKKLFDISLLT